MLAKWCHLVAKHQLPLKTNIVITKFVSQGNLFISFLRSSEFKTGLISLCHYYSPKPLVLQVVQWLVVLKFYKAKHNFY